MATELELEKTYLVAHLPSQINGAPHQKLEDAFIKQSENEPVLRLRHRGDSFEITKKEVVDQADGSAHNEHTIQLAEFEYKALLTSFPLKIRKTRYDVTIYGRKAEIDIFGGDLSGLAIVDFEFATPEELQNFQQPEFCLAEVTQNPVFGAGKLAGLTYANIQNELERYGYEPIFYEEGQQIT